MNAMIDQSLTPEQVLQLTRAMLSVANVDGLSDAERVLISQFYESSRTEAMPAAETVLTDQRGFQPSELAGSSAGFADTLVLMCLMAAYADGHLSAAERAQVTALADAMQMSGERLEGHLAQVKDQLLAALSHLPDAASVAAVVRTL